ncbi:hypothetical protein ABXS75_12125 [Roseburia hominis]
MKKCMEIGCLVLAICLIAGIVFSGSVKAEESVEMADNNIWFQLGENESQIHSVQLSDKESIEWEKNGIVVYSEEVDRIEKFYRLGKCSGDTREMAVNHIIEREALYEAAVNKGFVVTDEEVDEGIRIQNELLEDSVEFKQFLKGYGASAITYWQEHFEALRKEISINRYLSYRKIEFAKDYPTLDEMELNDKWLEEEKSIRETMRNSKM